MKIQFTRLLLILVAAVLASCGNDETPKVLPSVSTSVPSNVTTTSATLGGNITNDGNDAVVKSGVVYSSNIAIPTTADNKAESTTMEGVFTVDISSLSSGTTYHVRAYATNGVGTAYGDVIDFTTGNNAPTVTEVTIDGTLEVSKTVTAKYKYSDAENNSEGATTFQWYMASSATGTDETAIEGATSKTFTIQDGQNGKVLSVSVTPKATAGTLVGSPVKSAYSTAVGAETVTFSYNGQTVTYGTILSATTQKKWLDRNLGAKHAAQSLTDYEAFGDLFQWGRPADGHQVIARTNGTDAGASSSAGTTSTLSDSDVPASIAFIVPTNVPYDWRATQNNNLWQGGSGTNNPCPTGWRIATQAEWTAEAITSAADGYSKLLLVNSGYRKQGDASFSAASGAGLYWSATTQDNLSIQVIFTSGGISTSAQNRAAGEACRCIKN